MGKNKNRNMPKGKYIAISIFVTFILSSLFANLSLSFWYSHLEYKSFATPSVIASFPVFYILTYYALVVSYKKKTKIQNERPAIDRESPQEK